MYNLNHDVYQPLSELNRPVTSTMPHDTAKLARVSSATRRVAGISLEVERFTDLLKATRAGFEAGLQQHAPESPYRDFHLWAISSENIHWVDCAQTMGITQLARLTVSLLNGLVEEEAWPQLVDYSVMMNVYQVYEIVSDNLAIGLASKRENDPTYEVRRDLLHAFNRAMIDRLAGEPRPAAQLLAPVQPAAQRISSFNFSLIQNEWRAYAEMYLGQRPDLVLDHLEYGLWPALVANIETCVAMTQALSGYQLGTLLRAGLINRYWAVNRLLENRNMTLSQLASIGADAILVMPTLTYYVIVLAEILRPVTSLHRVIADGLLANALYEAALLVRLLNDLGTGLVSQTADERVALLAALAAHSQEGRAAQTITDVLLDADGQFSLLTRLHKDIAFGEFNVSLYGLAKIPHWQDALSVFGANLAYYSNLYKERWASLQEKLAVINERLGDERVSTLIDRFVRFHEHLYRNRYDTSAGEYAIAV